MDHFDRQLNLFLESFNNRDEVLFELCSKLGIQIQPLKIVWKSSNKNNRWDDQSHLQEIIYKH